MDLLKPGPNNLTVADTKGNPLVKNLHEESLGTPEAVLKAIETKWKSACPRYMAHTVLQLKVQQKSTKGTLSLVDMAASENIAQTGSTDDRLNELLLVLQSLCGNARTTMCICVSPAQQDEEETLRTLKFGEHCKTNFKLKVKANQEKKSGHEVEANKKAKVIVKRKQKA